jgi:hypothetical protein
MRLGNTAVLAALFLLLPAEEAPAATGPAGIHVASVRLVDNGDNDGFADPDETVSVYLTLKNATPDAHHGITLVIESTDPTVDCVLAPIVSFGSLAAGETREATTAASFRVAHVSRIDPFLDLSASFDVLLWGDDFAGNGPRQTVDFDLDLNVSGGSGPTTYTEGFESAGFGTFTTLTLDVGKASLALSEGFRCQYHNPDLLQCQTCGNTFCYLGFPNAADNAFDWHVHGLASPDGGRAFLGNNSLHWGMHPGAAASDTTRLKQLDALRTVDPVNLGWSGPAAELSFKHQVGLTDCGYVNCELPGSVDRGIVQIQLARSDGTGIGNWRKIHPYENAYESVATDNYTNCLFDPTDDGNTEDDFYDPTDPNRRFGPSSTCGPEFSFSRQGSIGFDTVFDAAAISRAPDGPGLPGVRGPGTWVETKFSLHRWRGRRVQLRFLVTSIEISNVVTMDGALGWNPTPADDGWYIDDVKLTGALTSPATVSVDTANRSGLPACGVACAAVSASLAGPASTGAPGEPIVIDASASVADVCPGGPLLYRFWVDAYEDGVLGSRFDAVLRDWTDDPLLTDSPESTTRYVVEVHCASRPACADTASVLVSVPCPDSPARFDQTLAFENAGFMSWGSTALVDAVRGDLGLLRAGGGQFNGTVEVCFVNDANLLGFSDWDLPPAGAGWYYLVRPGGPTPACTRSWGTGFLAEKPGAGGDRDADLALDANTCP